MTIHGKTYRKTNTERQIRRTIQKETQMDEHRVRKIGKKI